MRGIWEYISAQADYALPKQKVITALMFGLGTFHACFLALFLYYSIWPMVALALCSLVLYAYGYILAKAGRRLLLAFNLAYAEIMLHAVVSVCLVGEKSGFALYTIAMLPLGYYAAYNFSSEEKPVNPMRYVIIAVLAFCSVQILGDVVTPFCSYGDLYVERAVYLINYFAAVVAILLCFSTLLNQIKYLEHQRMHQNKQLEELSKTDALTGLANRRSIQERYVDSEETLKEGYAVIMGDIDDFKKVNDTYGHDMGDQVLRAVAEVFKGTVRGADTVCRWGGEEILVFLPQCPMNNARYRAEDILEKISRLVFTAPGHGEFHVTMTLGVAVSEEAREFSAVVKLADERLYHGKRNGKAQVV